MQCCLWRWTLTEDDTVILLRRFVDPSRYDSWPEATSDPSPSVAITEPSSTRSKLASAAANENRLWTHWGVWSFTSVTMTVTMAVL